MHDKISILQVFHPIIIIIIILFFVSGCGCDDKDPPECTPTTCEALGIECGEHGDSCGGTLNCGTCDPGFTCSGNMCIDECIPHTCDSFGAECGRHQDGCGDYIECGTCPDGFNCTGGSCIPSSCVPKTCESLGYECGTHPDGCGRTINCGRCPAGYNCIDGTCTEAECIPDTCESLGFECGEHDNGCGENISCGHCPQNHECRNGSCVCLPLTCDEAGRECGQWNDGCGGTMICGPCPEDEICRFDGTCIGACVPLTCSEIGAECGSVNDGCGNILDCGTCSGDQICGGAGPNRCGDTPCVPETCADMGFECGSHSDGCGIIISCGTCNPDERCDSSYQCVPAENPDGAACLDDSDCAGGICVTEDEYGWRNGYCTGSCTTDSHCSTGAFCTSLNLCMASCSVDSDCRDSGYMCVEDTGAGKYCYPGATGDGTTGDPCEGYWDCSGREHGTCIRTWPGGYCTLFCGADQASCGNNAACHYLDLEDVSLCFETCATHGDCRNIEGYSCNEIGSTGLLCVPGCLDNDDCPSDSPICDTDTHTCVECLNNSHCSMPKPVCLTETNTCVQCISNNDCSGSDICENNQCIPSGDCDLEGFTKFSDSAAMVETPHNGTVLVYEAESASDNPMDVLNVEWWFSYGANFTGPGTYIIDPSSNIADCGLCVLIRRFNAAGSITKAFFATGGTVEVTSIGGDGDPFTGILNNVVFSEWNTSNDTAVSNGQTWCLDGYSWSTLLSQPQPPDQDTVEYCHLQWPLELSAEAGEEDLGPVFGWVYHPGITDEDGNQDEIVAQIGVAPAGTQEGAADWTWFDATFNDRKPNQSQQLVNYEYQGLINAPAQAGEYNFAYRFRLADKNTWTLCHSADGGGSNNPYNPDYAGELEVLAPVVDYVEYCHLHWPLELSGESGEEDLGPVFGWVYHPGITDGDGNQDEIEAQIGVAPAGTQEGSADWTWYDAVFHERKENEHQQLVNYEYQGLIDAPAQAGEYNFAYRFRLAGGGAWTLCHSADGGGSNNPYNPDFAGELEVIAPVVENIEYCHLQWPLELSADAGEEDLGPVFGWVYHPGITDGDGNQDEIEAQIGVAPAGTQEGAAGWIWFDAAFHERKENEHQQLVNYEYQGLIDAPAQAGDYNFAYRFRLAGGGEWTLCHSAEGGGSNNPYNPDFAGELEVIALALEELDYCHLHWPLSLTVSPGDETETIYGHVFHDTITNEATTNPDLITAEVGYGPEGSNPISNGDSWIWHSSEFNVTHGNNYEYGGTITAPAQAATYDYAYRFRLTTDGAWLYCHLGGDNAPPEAQGSNHPDGYSPQFAGKMIVQ